MIKKGAFKKTREECENDEMWIISIYNFDVVPYRRDPIQNY
jgi:hypothetical protein